MKRLITLFALFAGICAFAQHPLSAERQALIRKMALPVLRDTLEYAHQHKEAYSINDVYQGSVSASATMDYSLKDDYLFIKWNVKVYAKSDRTMDINGKTYGVTLGGREVASNSYAPAHQVQDMQEQPLLAFILYTGGYRIKEEVAYPKQAGGSYIKDYDNEQFKPSERLFDLVSSAIRAHNLQAESVGSIYEITAFDESSITLRVAFNGSGQAALLNAYAADPYAVIIALGLNLGIHLYVYDVNVAAAPQYAYFSPEDVVKFAKEVK